MEEVEKYKLQGQILDVELENLVGAEWNPNEMSAKEFDRLTQELQESGMRDPIQVIPVKDQDGKYRILGGHHRYEAAKVLGWPTLPCVVLKDTSLIEDVDLQKFANMRLNIIKGKISPAKFVKMYEDLSKKYSDDALQDLMGFVDVEPFNLLLADLKKDIDSSGLPDGVKKKFKETANELKSIDDVSNILNYLFRTYGNTLPYGFMIVVHGGQDHMYVPLEDKNLKGKVKFLQETVLEKKLKLEDFFQEFLTKDGVKKIADQLIAEGKILESVDEPVNVETETELGQLPETDQQPVAGEQGEVHQDSSAAAPTA